MSGRGNSRGRGGRGGNFKKTTPRYERDSVLNRLGPLGKGIPVYPKNTNEKYRFVRHTTVPSIASLPAEPRIRMLTKKFLKSYYEIFDQPGRVNLESQYSAEAFFSFSSTFPMPTVGRNLLEVREPQERISLLVHDRTNIARALATFSPTEHLVDFLSSDVPFYIVNPMFVISMQIIVTGVFKDTSQTRNALRAFTRVFVLKQASVDSQGEPVYQIYNDLFMLQPPTPDQIKRFHTDSLIEQKMPTLTSTASNQQEATSRKQENMIKSIMEKTRMNKAGCNKLLAECNWDEAKSMEVFNALFSSNQIPQCFFTP